MGLVNSRITVDGIDLEFGSVQKTFKGCGLNFCAFGSVVEICEHGNKPNRKQFYFQFCGFSVLREF